MNRHGPNRPLVIFKPDLLWAEIHDRFWGQRDMVLNTGLSQETISRACTGRGVSVRSAGLILKALKAGKTLTDNPLVAEVTFTPRGITEPEKDWARSLVRA